MGSGDRGSGWEVGEPVELLSWGPSMGRQEPLLAGGAVPHGHPVGSARDGFQDESHGHREE